MIVNEIRHIPPQGSATYFFVVEISSWASESTIGGFKIKVVTQNDVYVSESTSEIVQPLIVSQQVVTSTPTVVRAKTSPEGTSWPVSITPGTTVQINSVLISADGTVFVSCEDSILTVIDSSGNIKSSFQANGPIISSIFSNWAGETGYLYFGTKNGYIYKNSLNDISQNVWVRNIANEITSDIAVYYYEPPGKIYAGTVDGKIVKISTSATDLWVPVQLSGSIVQTPSIDDGFTTGVNSLWWGTKNGYVYRLNIEDGTIISSTRTVNEITTGIEYDAGYDNQLLNSLNVYFGSKDGKLLCRYGLNLSSVTAQWNDVNIGSKINNIVINIEGSGKFVYLSCDNGVYKINATNGNIVWYFRTSSAVKSAVYVYDEPNVYFAEENGLLYCVHRDTKSMLNGYPVMLEGPVSSNMLYFNNKIFVGSNDGKINVFEK
jgi:hypothetical protein